MKISEITGLKQRVFKADSSRWPDLFGVELELENVSDVRAVPYWHIKEDASLRNGVEFVTDGPFASDTLESAIREFYAAGFKWRNSPRTSTHIHINVTDVDASVVQSMAVIMYAIEDALYNTIGASRKWSGYSVALSEMDPQRLRDLFSTDANELRRAFNPGRNQERYYGFNFYVSKHGTVEFRYFPGGPSKEELELWLDFVYAVKRIGVKYTPAQLVERIVFREDMEDFITREFPNEWIKRLFKHGDTESMYRKFTEVAAFVAAGEQRERREALVFLTAPFLKFLSKNLLKEEGTKYVEKIRGELGTITLGEWLYHLDQAIALDGQPKQQPARKSVKLEMRPFGEILAEGRLQAQYDAGAVAQAMPAQEAPAVPEQLVRFDWEQNAWADAPPRNDLAEAARQQELNRVRHQQDLENIRRMREEIRRRADQFRINPLVDENGDIE